MTATSSPAPMLPPEVRLLVAQAFGGALPLDLAATYGGFSNLTLAATVGGQRCIVKAAQTPFKRADLRNEATMLSLLGSSGLAIPPLLAHAADERWTVVVTGWCPGENGLQTLAAMPEALPEVYAALAATLAAVHRVVPAAGGAALLAERVGHARGMLASLGLPDDLRAALAEALASDLWQHDTAHVVHGDIGLHNVLWHADSLTLLDWEWAALGTPLLDLAWLRWTLGWRALPDGLWPHFLACYAAAGGLPQLPAPQGLRALMLGQIAMILARVHDQPAACAEWVRRAEWTRGFTL
ncbi:phosphotransferase [Chloroflexia bacterium SDU3-3]|nr:phosphotransferase [Chloroflexia bacterium SDU3-3]